MLRILTLLALIIRLVYWIIEEHKANRLKPKIRKASLKEFQVRFILWIFSLFMVLQLLGINIFPYSKNTIFQYIGLVLVIVGVALSFIARKNLGDNWTHAAEYQIKKDHELITSGVYKYIRHPIYTSFILTYIGVELVVDSYLVLVFLIILPIVAYWQAKKEEAILLQKFERRYRDYMKTTKMLIPFVW